MGEYINPNLQSFQSYFLRDFPYGYSSGDLSTVQDQDITNAMNDAASFINPAFFPGQVPYNVGFFNLTAHFLVMSLRASSQGIAGQFKWLSSSVGVGSVSEGITIPEQISKNPMFSVLSKTNYGMKFLFLILPYLVAPGYTVCGPTKP